MEASFGYQYATSSPDEIESNETLIGLQKAIQLFITFPWEDQFKTIEKRSKSKLSSSIPSIFYFETKTKYLVISATNNMGFLVQYFNESNLGELYIPNNISKRPVNISVEDLIKDFFNQEIENTLNLSEINSESQNDFIYKYNTSKIKLLLPLLFLMIPFSFALYGFKDIVLILPFLCIITLFILLLISPILYLNYTYWKNDKNQIISYFTTTEQIRIKQKDKEINFLKSDIQYIEWVKTDQDQRSFKEFNYLRIRVQESTFVITHLTVAPTELIAVLNLHFKQIIMFYPRLLKNKESVNVKLKKEEIFNLKQKEFINKYSTWETDKLEEIVSNSIDYEDFAVSAAKEVLKNRN